MRAFPAEQEERAFRHEKLKQWLGAGLLTPESARKATIMAGEPPSQAAWPLRVILFGLTVLALAALSSLVLKGSHDRSREAAAAFVLAGLAAGAAEILIASLKVRRFGAEEALVTGACLLAAYGAERLAGGPSYWGGSAKAFSGALAAAAALAYLRYGYRLAAVGAAVAVGVFVGALDCGERTTRVLLAVLYSALLAASSSWPDLPARERDRLAIVRFFLALAVPLCLNVRLERLVGGWPTTPVTGAFAWATLAAIFLLPAAWLAWGASSRSRPLLWAGGIGLLVAVCSIKPYLGLKRNSWDPAVLGIELVVAALLLKRWLDAGPSGRRGAFSSEALGAPGPGAAATLLAAAVAASPSEAPRGPDTTRGSGGDFGGGGTTGTF